MKFTFLFSVLMFSLLPSCKEKQEVEAAESLPSSKPDVPSFSIEKSEVVEWLDQGDLMKASEVLNKGSNSRSSTRYLIMDLSEERFNASKIYHKEKFIILLGKVWIRSGEILLDGRGYDDTYAVIHKKSMRLIELGGEFEETILIR